MLRAFFYGHASLLFRGSNGALLCDPWFSTVPIYANSAIKYPFVPAELHAETRDVTHLYISHHHEDHFNAPSLDRYSRDTTVIIPAFEYAGHARARSMAATLERMGFRNVVRLRSWERLELDLGEAVALTLVPSAASRWHDWENSGLLIETADWAALNLNDNMVDAPLLEEIRKRAPRLDVAFVQGFPSTEFPGAFDFPIREKIRMGRRKRGNVDEARKVIEQLAPKLVVPIACDIAWYRKDDLYRNYSDKATPSRFPAFLDELGLLRTTGFVELHPGDELEPVSGAVRRRFGEFNWKGFRRRLKSRSARFVPLMRAFDAFQSNEHFDEARYQAFIGYARAYFPERFPVDATVRIDLVVLDRSGNALRRLAFTVSDGRLDIFDCAPDAQGCDQEIIVPAAVWNECYAGRMLRRDLFGICLNRQIKTFRFEVAVLRYFMSYYLDFGDISPWARISGDGRASKNLELMRHLDRDLAPQFAAGELRDEYRP
jgi:L-ascorbate metabolism protein UlaG (beta-lactamase superfamily)